MGLSVAEPLLSGELILLLILALGLSAILLVFLIVCD